MAIIVINDGTQGGGGGGGVTTLNNGLILTGTNGQLGGQPLVKDTDIDTTTAFILQLGDIATNQAELILDAPGSTAELLTSNAGGTESGSLILTSMLVTLELSEPGGNVIIDFSPADSVLITDTLNLFGAKYAADYSAAGLTNPRWIPDLAAVEALIAAITALTGANNGLSVSGLDVQLGGNPLNQSTIVNTLGFEITFADARVGGINTIDSNPGANLVFIRGGSIGTGFNSSLNLTDTGLQLVTSLPAGGQSLIFDQTAMLLTDNENFTGFVGVTDFSAQVLGNNLAYPQVILATLRPAHVMNVLVSTNILLLSYLIPADSFNRISFSTCMTGGAGTAAITLSYTDLNGNVQTSTVSLVSAVGGNSPAPISVLIQGGTSVTFTSVITGTAVATFGCCVELLN
jgi:hypothetical protein